MMDISLKEYVETLIRQEREVTNARFDAIDTALIKADEVLGHRLEAMNEFRTQIGKEREDYVRKDYVEGQLRLILVLATIISLITSLFKDIISR